MILGKRSSIGSGMLVGVIALTLSGSAFAQSAADRAQVLLEEVKKRDLERQRTFKEKEVERLNEDLQKDQKDAEAIQQRIESMTSEINDATSQLSQLASQKQRYLQRLEVTTLQIEAERLKVDGLKLLSEAQQKAHTALDRRMEETEIRKSIEEAEAQMIASAAPAGQAAPGEEGEGEGSGKKDAAALRAHIADLKKRLPKSEQAAASAQAAARSAMQAASNKLQAADAAARKASARATELGLTDMPDADDKKAAAEPPRAVPAQQR